MGSLDRGSCEVLCATHGTCNLFEFSKSMCSLHNANLTQVGTTNVSAEASSACAKWIGGATTMSGVNLVVTLTPANTTIINTTLIEHEYVKAVSALQIPKGDVTVVETSTQL